MLSQLADFISLIYPRTCVVCNESLTAKEDFLCFHCVVHLPKSQTLENEQVLLDKFASNPKVNQAFAYLDYVKGGISQKLVRAVKYDNQKELGNWLGRTFGQMIIERKQLDVDVIIPMPIHKKREKNRGYNQSTVLATGLADVLNVEIDSGGINRVVHTKSQTTKSKMGRWKSMEAIFQVLRPELIESRKIMLFDDVITTGATMGILCDAVGVHNPQSITVASLAAGR